MSRRKPEPPQPLPPEDRPPYVRGCIRVSHPDSAKRDISPQVQEALIRERWNRELRMAEILGTDMSKFPKWAPDGWRGHSRLEGKETTDGLYVDLAVSARKVPFEMRPSSLKLVPRLRAGDVLIFYDLNRAFRNVRDAATMIEVWEQRKIRLIFCTPDVDASTATGKAFLHTAAVWAEFQSNQLSEKMKDVYADMRRRGTCVRMHAGIGFQLVNKKLCANNDERRDVMLIVQLRQPDAGKADAASGNAKRLTYDQISNILEERDAAREGRPMRPGHQKRARWDESIPKRRWHTTKVRLAYERFIAGLIPPPEDEPLPEWYKRLMAEKRAKNA